MDKNNLSQLFGGLLWESSLPAQTIPMLASLMHNGRVISLAVPCLFVCLFVCLSGPKIQLCMIMYSQKY